MQVEYCMTDISVATLRKRKIKSRDKLYDSYYITLGHDFVHDKQFPFKEGEQVIIQIEGHELRVGSLRARKGAP